MKAPSCPFCGGRVRMLRRVAYRLIPDLEPSVPVPSCALCHEEWYNGKVATALEDAYQEELRERASLAVDALVAHRTQQALERMLGLSAGYLSKLKSGKHTSGVLVVLLSLLAADPEERLAEVERMFGGGR